jgi:hypothetical protein
MATSFKENMTIATLANSGPAAVADTLNIYVAPFV